MMVVLAFLSESIFYFLSTPTVLACKHGGKIVHIYGHTNEYMFFKSKQRKYLSAN